MKTIVAIAFFLLSPFLAHAAACSAIIGGTNDLDGSVGYNTANQMLAQPFTIASDCTVNTARIYVKTVGTPVDTFIESIYSDSSGSPGTSIASTNALAGINGTYQSITGTFASPPTLTGGTQYWLVFSRTGSLSTSNFYQVAINAATTAFGAMKLYGGTWGTYGTGNQVYNLDIEGTVPAAATTPLSILGLVRAFWIN